MKTLAIILTAYKSEKYILRTLKSLQNQPLPNGWQIRFYIGVDACENTASILKENKIPYYYTKENVGTYILTNSLINNAQEDKCDMFLRFDSDDIACRNFLLYGIEHTLKYNFISPYQILVDEHLNPINNKFKIAHGSMFATQLAIDALGGYYHYRVGCDTNFFRRAKRLGFGENITEKKPIYLYRQHDESLMKNKQLGKGTLQRKKARNLMKLEFDKGKNKIEHPVTTSLKYIF